MANANTVGSDSQAPLPVDVIGPIGVDTEASATAASPVLQPPVQRDENPFLKWAGALPMSKEEYDEWYTGIRGRFNEETGFFEFDE